ncbi:hypothetical protein BD311DRAFT_751189 [Dichomitus squalens]|uniref:Uncharacterized protein n=1 Tax=Dichomitus squalens TaxID=114155 RepID=A0A4Q9MZL0_9APHY|nr:hypothetical protein BD311DRAFT_751189 [Dichomitus squalens]
MSKRLKRAPPYEDDPGCKYIVISDPWPGNKSGKERGEIYWNLLAAWVRFMLNKEHEAISVYSVNTRNDVIVQLPEEADIVPILGAHPWIKVLSSGHPRDRERVSYVFAYDYRMKGEPDNHNWLAHYPTESGDPPAHIRFPVKFPYPHVSWASPKGKSCGDLALPMPPMRQPTPVRDISRFTPYEHASQLTSSNITAVEAISDGKAQIQQDHHQQTPRKPDPYASSEEAISLRAYRQDTLDVKPGVKREDGARVKMEAVKPEPELYGPSKSFRAAIEELQRARAAGEPMTASNEPESIGSVKPEDELHRGPSDALVAAFNSVRGGHPSESQTPSTDSSAGRIKGEREETPYRPSEAFVAAIQGLRRPPSATVDELQGRFSKNISVKPEQQAGGSAKYTTAPDEPVVKPEPGDWRHGTSRRTLGTNNNDQARSSLKRVKEESHDSRSGKRFRT